MVVAVALALPSGAQAGGSAAVTITSCKRDALTVAGKLAMTGSEARRVRGATLELRFQALPLFGLPRSAAWHAAGKRSAASSQEAFNGLAADDWVGVMSWRFKKARKTVASGIERSQPVRVGRTRGRAHCTVAEGLKPVDKTPPVLSILPADDRWYHAPAPVQLRADDDFSGVKSVRYSVDGAPKTQIPNGSAFTIPTEGAHTVEWEATDVAGNTATRSAVVRVDAAPPAKPVITKPSIVTADTTPNFEWAASTDSGSGVRGYLLTIKRSDGSVAAFRAVQANTTSVPDVAALADGETYTAVVTAVDNTVDNAWTADSDPLTFRVDTHPDVSSPQDGAVLAFGAKKSPVAVNFDRPVDPSTRGGVTLSRDSAGGTSIPVSGPTCSSPCTSISFTPTDANGLPEGRYTLAVNVKSDEGIVMQKTFKFAVPDPGNEDPNASTQSMCSTILLNPSIQENVQTTASGETVLASFVYSVPSGSVGRVQVLEAGSPLASSPPLDATGNGTRQKLSFTLSGPALHTLNLEYCLTSGSGPLSLSDIWASRAP